MVFDQTRLRKRRDRAVRSYDEIAFLKRRLSADLEDRVAATSRTFARVLDIGAHRGEAGAAVAHLAEMTVSMDASPRFATRLDTLSIAGDPEMMPFHEESFDLAVSVLALHWANDLPGALIQIRRALKPDGFFVGAMLGGSTLTELRQALLEAETDLLGGAQMRVSPFADALDASGLLQRAALRCRSLTGTVSRSAMTAFSMCCVICRPLARHMLRQRLKARCKDVSSPAPQTSMQTALHIPMDGCARL